MAQNDPFLRGRAKRYVLVGGRKGAKNGVFDLLFDVMTLLVIPISHLGGLGGHLTHPHQILGHIHQIWQKMPFFCVFRTPIWGNRIIFCILMWKKSPQLYPLGHRTPLLYFELARFFLLSPTRGDLGPNGAGSPISHDSEGVFLPFGPFLPSEMAVWSFFRSKMGASPPRGAQKWSPRAILASERLWHPGAGVIFSYPPPGWPCGPF